jgi:hypothetical protein
MTFFFPRRKPMQRRQFLRGSLGGGLSIAFGLPMLEAMLDTHGTRLAHGQALPKRFGVFFWGNGRGVESAKWTPTGSGAGWTPSLELAPLLDVKDYVSVVSGMTARMPNSPRGHHDGCTAILSGHDFLAQEAGGAPYRSTFSRQSIDQVAADTLATDSRFRSLEIGISSRVITGEGTTLNFVSHNGPDNANPPELSPRALFDRLFADPSTTDSSRVGEALRALRGSVLDTVLDDLGALGQRVGTADRVRLEQHADGVRAVERRLASDAQLAPQCHDLTAPNDPATQDGKEPLVERMLAMSELLALAMSCDLSRVFTIQFTGSVGYTVFWQVGLDRGHHDMSHEGAAAQAGLESSTVFTMEQFAVLLRTLRDTPDGAGNLLDSCAILGTSDHSDGSAHSTEDYPILVAGQAGGALTHPGVHYASPKEHTNRVLLTLLRSVGVNIPELGDDFAHQTDGCSAIEV